MVLSKSNFLLFMRKHERLEYKLSWTDATVIHRLHVPFPNYHTVVAALGFLCMLYAPKLFYTVYVV